MALTKILFHSNALWVGSGYGKQTKLFATRMKKAGYDVAVSAFFGLKGARATVAGIEMYPSGLDGHGNDILIAHAKDFFDGDPKGGLVLPLTDIWVMRPDVLTELKVASWVPVDHDPCQPPTVTALRDGKCVPVAMARFGQRMLEQEGLKPLYVPHGFDGSVFRPLDRKAARAMLGVPETTHMTVMVAANQGDRKSYAEAIRAFSIHQKKYPDSLLYLHTWLTTAHAGLDLPTLIEQELGAARANKCVMVCDQYRYESGGYPDAHLAQAYSAADVLLNPSRGEGFGVPLIEAQACGCPIIVTDATAMPELVGAGYIVDGHPIYTGFKSWQKIPSIDQIVAALEADFSLSPTDRVGMRNKAHAFAQDYEADSVMENYWKPALAEIERRLFSARSSKKPGPRKKR